MSKDTYHDIEAVLRDAVMYKKYLKMWKKGRKKRTGKIKDRRAYYGSQPENSPALEQGV